MNDPTNTPRPPLPNWARTVIDALADANIYGRDELTANESHLINMASLLLRSRFGETSLTEASARDLLAAILRAILRDLDEQGGQR